MSASTKTKETLNLIATAVLPVLGALGTLFVFLAANFYVGYVEVKPTLNFHCIEIHAYNQRGQEAVFHTPRFQLMPDRYHFEIAIDSGSKQHVDASVLFHEKTLIDASAPPLTSTNSDDSFERSKIRKRHWWQLWHSGK